MNRAWIIIFLFIFCLASQPLYAQRTPNNYPNPLKKEETPIRNPFISQLPQEEKPALTPPQQPLANAKPKIAAPIVEPTNKRPLTTPEENKQTTALTPTTQPIKKEPPPDKLPELIITGLIWNTSKPQAIINGRIVGEGDSLQEAKSTETMKINKIRKSEIEILYKEKIWTIKP